MGTAIAKLVSLDSAWSTMNLADGTQPRAPDSASAARGVR